ncbi:hypothetical protein V5P93_002592 [Actinokineospora auranticolor]|uniref:Uncharacterized protein n=1 Tax=Actinokineospora auranticolor TaxID=155976 RepID=A0A2S6GMB1_9PSEU|nr:hypothetical protein [Actinokineospora auranticolor]PPK66379.1 hypothetical protein CLV40_11083 [Actinokineospora auranticolor]
MKVYAERAARRGRQLVADVVAGAVAVGAILVALRVRDVVLGLRAPGDRLVDAGTALRGTFDTAAAKADGVPLVGDSLANALLSGSNAGIRIADAGWRQIHAVENLATWLTSVLIAVPLAFLLVTWLPLRVHYARQATGAARLRDLGPAGHDVLALRALATQPHTRLAATGATATAWRDADPAAVALLANLELHRLGLNPTPPLPR